MCMCVCVWCCVSPHIKLPGIKIVTIINLKFFLEGLLLTAQSYKFYAHKIPHNRELFLIDAVWGFIRCKGYPSARYKHCICPCVFRYWYTDILNMVQYSCLLSQFSGGTVDFLKFSGWVYEVKVMPIISIAAFLLLVTVFFLQIVHKFYYA